MVRFFVSLTNGPLWRVLLISVIIRKIDLLRKDGFRLLLVLSSFFFIFRGHPLSFLSTIIVILVNIDDILNFSCSSLILLNFLHLY